MREDELRKHAKCDVCGKGIGHAGVPMFWTLKIERHGVKKDVIDRQQGLAMMLGGHAALAKVMGPDEEMTKSMMDPVTVTVCEPCAGKNTSVYQLGLRHADDGDDEEDGS